MKASELTAGQREEARQIIFHLIATGESAARMLGKCCHAQNDQDWDREPWLYVFCKLGIAEQELRESGTVDKPIPPSRKRRRVADIPDENGITPRLRNIIRRLLKGEYLTSKVITRPIETELWRLGLGVFMQSEEPNGYDTDTLREFWVRDKKGFHARAAELVITIVPEKTHAETATNA